MAATLLTVMLMVPYICEGALLRKSSATDFLQKVREKRASECFTGGCSTEIGEAGEVLEANMGFVVDIMRVNVDKVLERDQKLSELDDRADALQAGASQFETSAAKLKRKYWWKNCKFGVIRKAATSGGGVEGTMKKRRGATCTMNVSEENVT
ncbi:Vesicle-associated membrane protein 3 [Collichthys lucidus]|uniref:Vesicle-associated membrane protein 3 n=1 Tax=Collichthys lucidus TaxID=240159 RepID=A0A4U5UBT9_COLLU|nr:Vesicle-associated membrane protein 3 [Collichthys lucidus]